MWTRRKTSLIQRKTRGSDSSILSSNSLMNQRKVHLTVRFDSGDLEWWVYILFSLSSFLCILLSPFLETEFRSLRLDLVDEYRKGTPEWDQGGWTHNSPLYSRGGTRWRLVGVPVFTLCFTYVSGGHPRTQTMRTQGMYLPSRVESSSESLSDFSRRGSRWRLRVYFFWYENELQLNFILFVFLKCTILSHPTYKSRI